MADKTTVSIADPQPRTAPAISATSDMPETKAAAPALSEERVPADSTTKTKQPDGKPVVDAAAVEAKTEGDKPDAKAAATDDAAKPADETPPWMKAEITKERNKRRTEETARKTAEQKAEALQSDLTKALSTLEAVSKKPPEKTAIESPRPKRDAFTDPDAFDAAIDEWANDRATRAATVAAAEAASKIEDGITKQTETEKQTELQRQNKEIADAFEARKIKFMEDHPDYEEVVSRDDIEISPAMGQAMLNDEDGPALAYYLGQNPDEAARILKLSPFKAAAELGRIAARLNTKPAVSTKPAPLTPLKTGSANASRKGPNEESMEEYGARRSTELANSRRPFVGGLPH